MFFVAFALQFIKVNISSQCNIKRWKCDFFMPLTLVGALVTTKICIVLLYLLYVRSSITNNTRNTDAYRNAEKLVIGRQFQWLLILKPNRADTQICLGLRSPQNKPKTNGSATTELITCHSMGKKCVPEFLKIDCPSMFNCSSQLRLQLGLQELNILINADCKPK